MDEQNMTETNDRLKRKSENDIIVENKKLKRDIYSLKDYLTEAQDELGLRDDEIFFLNRSNDRLLKENQEMSKSLDEMKRNIEQIRDEHYPKYSIHDAMSAVTAFKVALGIQGRTIVPFPRTTLEIWGLRAEAMKKSRILRRMIIDDKEYILYHNNTYRRDWILLNEQNRNAVLQQCIFETDRGSRLIETEMNENKPVYICDDSTVNL